MEEILIGKCKLCLCEKELLKRSHIISDFLFKDIYDDRHRLLSVQTEDLLSDEDKSFRPASSDYEANILCKHCDNVVIQQYEDYAGRVIHGWNLSETTRPVLKNLITPEGLTYTTVENLDYRRFKLFLLSILWRASISKRKFFQLVDLGPHEETIRKMILDGNPGRVDEYPVHILTYASDPDGPIQLVAQPGRRRNESGTQYVFFISGFIYFFYVSRHNYPLYLLNVTINPNGQMTIWHLPKGKSWDLLRKYLRLDKQKTRKPVRVHR